MLQPKTRWKLTETDSSAVDALIKQLNLHPLIAKLLVGRGFTDPEKVRRFLYEKKDEGGHDPFLLDGMSLATEGIHTAIKEKQKIRIYGDYDADGVSSTSLMVFLLRRMGAEFDYYIPNRFTEGYGLNLHALDLAKADGVQLLITVDTGISAVEQVRYANELGIDVIVTDHHEPPEVLPDAMAIINPKKPGCSYPFDMLCGAGIAFKLAQALLGRIPEEWAELAALGTIADLVPLIDENRWLVKMGLEQINRTRLPGMRALLRVAGLQDKPIEAGHIGFAIGPRINASGRLDSADEAVKLLTTSSLEEAAELAVTLDEMNRERQQLVVDMTEEAVAMWESARRPGRDRVIVLAKEGWNAGVVGIVAAKLVERYYRPTIILSIDPIKGTAKGSARSIDGFDLYHALSQCADLLPHFGGHKMAAGMTLSIENINELRNRLDQIASTVLKEEDYIPLMRVDGVCRLEEVDAGWIEALDQLGPFGMGNPSPRWLFEGTRLREARRMGKEQNHLKLVVEQGEQAVDAIAFKFGSAIDEIASRSELRLVGEWQINEWNGVRKPQFVIKDVAVPHLQLFDWRGEKRPLQRWFQNEQRIAHTAVIFFDKKNVPAQMWETNKGEQASIFICDADGRLEKITDPYPQSNPKLRYLLLLDLPKRLSSLQKLLSTHTDVERIYCCFGENQAKLPGPLMVPTREQFAQVYRAIHQQKQPLDAQQVACLSKQSGMPPSSVQFIVDVFFDLGFIEQVGSVLRVATSSQKRELAESIVYQEQKDYEEVQQVMLHSSFADLSRYLFQCLS